ncbi:MAG: asparagine synthase (glutamine-hydrolyzing) [Acidobacteriia bacterium]|nr:asparagine synthase (glutamine-hydrolyzing) [Terriglobia bacterium]
MCGVAGILRWGDSASRRGEIERMTAAVAHRGPDGEGTFVRDGLALGHRRLSIIDLETGQQPMANEDGTVWVTYNGEIYNYRELTAELRALGHVFRTRSDTEVIVHAYEQWGADCVKRFRGMFAFGLADLRGRRLLLARDHLGIKPLYYRTGEGYLAFASELGALRQVDDRPPEGSLVAVELFLRYQYLPAPHTIYRDVVKQPPASYVVVGFDGRLEGPTRYWDLRFDPDPAPSDAEWLERFESALESSVRAHTVSDVPFGVLLSGGVDSTLVAVRLSRILGSRLKGFCIDFPEAALSEARHAAQVALKCGFELHTETVRDELRDLLPALVSHYGEPFGDTSAVPTWHVARLARSHVPMVLSGDGGDEGFGGYDTYLRWMRPSVRGSLRTFLRRPSADGARSVAWATARRLLGARWSVLREWQRRIEYVAEGERRALWRPEFGGLPGAPCLSFAEADAAAPRTDALAYAQYLDIRTYLPCDILTKVDVAAMYHGLEVRTPFADVNVMELAARLPLRLRYRRGQDGSPVPKHLPKTALLKDFPGDFVHRPKQGFAPPRAGWFLPGRSGRAMLEDVMNGAGSPLNDWFRVGEIRGMIETHGPEKDRSNALWLLLVLGLWLQQNREIRFR